MSRDKNVVGWFEIPVTKMERAVAFYEKVFGFKMESMQMGPIDMAMFPYSQDPKAPGASGSLVFNKEFYEPCTKGTLVYLSSQTGDLADEMSRIEAAGGKVLMPKKQISPEIGYMGVFEDSEGNRVAIHSRK